jgi:pectinesterase
VRKSGTQSGEYSTIAAALTALGSTTTAKCIFIYSGTYNEQLTINYKGALTIYGYTTSTGSYSNNAVTITYGQTSSAAGSLDKSSTVNITSANFKAYNINFVNSYGAGTQAVAVTANGDKQGYYACQFKGYQDTLYAKSGKQYYSNCYIEGAVDYIFGDATAWFGECRVASNGNGYITAMSREVSTDTSWYVFDHSTVSPTIGFFW